MMGLLTEGMGISNNEEERRKGERMVEEFVKYVEGVEGGGGRERKEGNGGKGGKKDDREVGYGFEAVEGGGE